MWAGRRHVTGNGVVADGTLTVGAGPLTREEPRSEQAHVTGNGPFPCHMGPRRRSTHRPGPVVHGRTCRLVPTFLAGTPTTRMLCARHTIILLKAATTTA